MWRHARVWCAIALAALGVGCATNSTLGHRLIERGHITAIDISPVANDLAFLWEHTDSVEWSVCAQGKMQHDTLVITSLDLANMTSWSPTSVTYDGCPTRATFVGTVHPHKGDDYPVSWRCQASDVDMHSFMTNPDEAFMFIECDTGRVWLTTAKVRVDSLKS